MAASISWSVTRDASAEWSKRLRDRVTIETDTYAQNVLSQAQSDVRVRSGETRASGRVETQDQDTLIVRRVVFGGAALYLEFGTAKMPAYPFLTQATVDNYEAYIGRLRMTTQGRVG